MSLRLKEVSKVKPFDADSFVSIDGMDNGNVAITSSKKELKVLIGSNADVVYDEKIGKLYRVNPKFGKENVNHTRIAKP